MANDPRIRILCAADIHLGRAPALPGAQAFDLNERSAWDFVVASALAQEVDLVLLAGDVIESENQFFETRGPLKQGCTRTCWPKAAFRTASPSICSDSARPPRGR